MNMKLNLASIRKKHHMTQEQLGQLVGLRASSISMLESGQNLGKLSTWDKLEEVLGVDQKILRQVKKETTCKN
jgi:transcriptional regulator with XRE-family HTH domain